MHPIIMFFCLVFIISMKVDSIRDLVYMFRSPLTLYFDQCIEVCPLYQIQLVCVHKHNLGVKYYLLVGCLFVTYSQIDIPMIFGLVFILDKRLYNS